jgi:molybdopterin/thiamine biosynthesis adenylyltransferase
MTNTELVFSAAVVEELRNHLIRDDGLERFAVAYCGKSSDRFLAADIHPIADDELAQQGSGMCRPNHELEGEHVNQCVDEGKHPIFIHSHPFADRNVGFSRFDDEIMGQVGNWLKPHFPDTEVLFAVFGERSVIASRYDSENNQVKTLPVDIVGEWKLKEPLHRSSGVTRELDSVVDEVVYDRNIRALTEEGQHRLSTTRVGIVGAGGLGSIITEQLVRLGVEDLVIVDPDVVEKSYLPRLQGATSADLEQSKVTVIRDHLQAIDPEIRAEPYQCVAQEAEDALGRCDILIGGVDRMNARMWINEFAVKHLIPFIDAGVRIEKEDETVTAMKGCIQVITPGATACLSCLNREDFEQARIERMDDQELESEIKRGYIEDSALTPEPAVIHLNGLVASKAVDELVKLVTGISEPDSLVEYEGFENELSTLDVPPASECTVCGGDMLGRGNSLPDFPEIGSIEGDTMEAD